LFGVPATKRLPLRAYHAAMIFKNGIPVGYFEGLSLFERMESGFNFYYTFREGETAWIYARVLNIYRHLLGVTTFLIDPYQVGFENEEGIESGAFWFYRKLGFRPTDRNILQLTEGEEKKIATRKAYRTSAPILRKLAKSVMVFELDERTKGDWDRFQLRLLGMKLQRHIASVFDGDSVRARQTVSARMSGELDAPVEEVNSDFALVLDLAGGVSSWSDEEKKLMREIMKARQAPDESRYLKQMQQHGRFRKEVIRLGR
jgi:hypothetical protein